MEKRLSRGLDALLGKGGVRVASSQSVQMIVVDHIRPNPQQPRRAFDSKQLGTLKESIARDGLLQPIVVRRVEDGYELIAGERRWRACRQLGMPRIPALIRSVEQEQQLVLALVENLQRSDLNPIDEARAFRRLQKEFGLTHGEVAERVGRERSTVSNCLRLLDLPQPAIEAVSRGTLTAGHARAMLPLAKSSQFERFLQRVMEEGLSVRQTERVVGEVVRGATESQQLSGAPAESVPAPTPSPAVADLEERLRSEWGVRVEIRLRRRGGKVSFRCFSREELNDLLDRLLSRSESRSPAPPPEESARDAF